MKKQEITLKEGTTVLNLGHGVEGKLAADTVVVIESIATRAQIAELLIAHGHAELVAQVTDKTEDGREITFSPITGQAVVIDEVQIVDFSVMPEEETEESPETNQKSREEMEAEAAQADKDLKKAKAAQAEAEAKSRELAARAELKDKTVKELKEMLKTLDVKFPARAKEAELIDLIIESQK